MSRQIRLNVRFALEATEMVLRREMMLRAIFDYMRRSKSRTKRNFQSE